MIHATRDFIQRNWSSAYNNLGKAMKNFYIFLFSYFMPLCTIHDLSAQNSDVTVVGFVNFANGLGRNTIAALDYLQSNLEMGFQNTRPDFSDFKDLPLKVKSLIEKDDRSPSNVAILYDTLDILDYNGQMPDSKIKLAYSMIEGTEIFPEWVSHINRIFDAVIVPDPFLVPVYRNCGVQKPVFVLPHPVYMDEFLKKPLKKTMQKPFVFGTSCLLCDNKNYMKLVDAFIAEFGNSKEVILKIQTTQENEHARELIRKLDSLRIKNIFLNTKVLPWQDYVEFMAGLDCYCLVSKGEGFSITPREALALGIPCIISNQTAHRTICATNLAYSVEANDLQPYMISGDRLCGKNFICNANGYRPCGKNFNCNVVDVQDALKEVYHNYAHYLAKAPRAREWVKQYHGDNLKSKYLNLFKPKKIILGKMDLITEDFFMTTSKPLYDKYKHLEEGTSNKS